MPWPKGKPRPVETRVKISDGQRGRTHSKEAKAKMRAAKLGKPRPERVKDGIRQARLRESAELEGEERRQRFASYGMLGKQHSEEARQRMSESQRGHKHSAARTEQIGEDRKRWWASLTPEERETQIAKMAHKKTGSKRNQKTRDKMSAANRRTWANMTTEERKQRGENISLGIQQAWQEGRISAANWASPTSIELKVEEGLKAQGIEYIPQKKLGPFYADFFLPETRQVIEVNGCYWHACEQCGHGHLTERIQRDQRKLGWLEKQGYLVTVIWEHDL